MITSALFWFVLAIVFACIEIESEGRWGWAEKAPTWFRTGGIAGKLYGALMGGKPLTGYHLFMFFLPVLMFHIPFFSGVKWTLGGECMTWAMYFAWCPLWDYLWFVLNPAYGVRGFRKDKVWWHAKSPWVFGLFPADYLIGWVISVAFAFGAQCFGRQRAFADHALLLISFLVLTGITIAAAPLYHRWYRAMRRRDDRGKVNMFHRR